MSRQRLETTCVTIEASLTTAYLRQGEKHSIRTESEIALTEPSNGSLESRNRIREGERGSEAGHMDRPRRPQYSSGSAGARQGLECRGAFTQSGNGIRSYARVNCMWQPFRPGEAGDGAVRDCDWAVELGSRSVPRSGVRAAATSCGCSRRLAREMDGGVSEHKGLAISMPSTPALRREYMGEASANGSCARKWCLHIRGRRVTVWWAGPVLVVRRRGLAVIRRCYSGCRGATEPRAAG